MKSVVKVHRLIVLGPRWFWCLVMIQVYWDFAGFDVTAGQYIYGRASQTEQRSARWASWYSRASNFRFFQPVDFSYFCVIQYRQITRTLKYNINKVLADKYGRQSHYSVKIVDFRSADSLPKNLVGSRLFGICREKHGSIQLKKSTIMDCFLTN